MSGLVELMVAGFLGIIMVLGKVVVVYFGVIAILGWITEQREKKKRFADLRKKKST